MDNTKLAKKLARAIFKLGSDPKRCLWLTPNFVSSKDGKHFFGIEQLTRKELEELANQWKRELIEKWRKRQNEDQTHHRA